MSDHPTPNTSHDADSTLLLEFDQVAEILNGSTRRVKRFVANKTMPSLIRVGSLLRWIRKEIFASIVNRCLLQEARR